MATGKRLKVIDRDSYSKSVDPCRQMSKKYWHVLEDGKNTSLEFYRSSSVASVSDGILHTMNYAPAVYDDQETFYKLTQKINVTSEGMTVDGDYMTYDDWTTYVGEMINTDTPYYDHAYELCTPFLPQELEQLNGAPGPAIANVETNYNFYIEPYEVLARKGTSIPEQILPNIYAMMFEKDSDNTDEQNSDFNKLITLQGSIPDVYKDVVNRKGEKVGESDEGQYFDKYAFYYRAINNLHKTELTNMYTNTAVPISDVSTVGEYNKNAELFPMYMEIEFSTDKTTQFAEVIEDTKMSTPFMTEVIKRSKEQSFDTFLTQESLEIMTQTPNELGGTTVNKRASITNGDRKMLDITDWWVRYSNVDGPAPMFAKHKDIVYFTNNGDADVTKAEDQQYYKNMLMLLFAGKFRTLIRMTLRDMQTVFAGDLSYSETVMYRIAKYRGNRTTGRPIQNFFIPNSNEIDVFKFVDTQVKFSEDYTYKVWAYQLVMGSEYTYKSLSTTDSDYNINYGMYPEETADHLLERTYRATVDVEIHPSIKLIETPYFHESEVMMDDPPVPPEPEIIPYKSINNRVLINLMGNVGEYYFNPIIIHDEEAQIIGKIRKAQKIKAGQPIRYKSDDHPKYFEIFRIDKHPTSYRDFKYAVRATVHTDINQKTKQKATSASYVDTIIPNKKYYYIFRTIDNHDKISNPSPIYELEMVDEDGMIFPIIKIVEFAAPIAKKPSKPMNRYLYIKPNLNQSVLNVDQSGLNGATSANDASTKFALGKAGEDVWSKEFKVRITSRATGKKIDLKVIAKTEHIKSEADEQT